MTDYTSRAKELVAKHVLLDQTMLVNLLFDNYTFDWYSDIDNCEKFLPEDVLAEVYPEKWALWAKATGLLSDDELAVLTDEELDVRDWWMESSYTENGFARWLGAWYGIETTKDVEINGWFAVSGWLLAKLEAKNAPILRTPYGEWWGRADGSQPVHLDGIIEEIVDENPEEFDES